MTKNIYRGDICSNEEIQKEFFLMKIKLSGDFAMPLPGQFVMIRIAGLQDPFLSRPISIYSHKLVRSSSLIELLYRVSGRGTRILAGLMKGSQVEISGPLGNSYVIDPQKKDIVLIAGGIGIAPLSMLARFFCEKKCLEQKYLTFYLGAQTADAVAGLDQLGKYCRKVIVCTDDGSLGEKSLVTSLFLKDILQFDPEQTAIYACGPKPMIQSLSRILDGKYFCQVSLEERMACGVGACVGCVVGVKDDQGVMTYKRVCADGPVFDLRKVIWQ